MAATLNLADRMAIRTVLVPRCTGVVVNYALYLLGLPDGDQEGESTIGQKAWAREAMRAPESFGNQVSYYVLNQPAFIGAIDGSDWSGGSMIDDATLQGVVETAIRTHFVTEPA